MTDSRPDADSTPSKPRGLWSLMKAPAESSEQSVDVNDQTAADLSPSGSAAESSSTTPPKQRGLWGMMGQAPVADLEPSLTVDPEGETEPRSQDPVRASEDAPARRGLFALMQRADDNAADSDADADNAELASVSELDASNDFDLVEVPEDIDSELDSVELKAANVSPIAEIINLDELEAPRYRLAELQARRQIRISLTSGVAAILASSLSLFPNVLSSLPASALGFGAIIAGYLAVTGPGRREISSMLRATSIVGMLLGTIGIFLGPTVIAGFGRALRDANGQQGTRTHLTKIGEGLDRYYSQHEAYPIGGTFARNEAGAIQGQHGWMTFLLPFVGEAELFQRVDQAKPFDDPVNRNAMGTNVNLYFAAGGDRSRIGDGFAVSHFAGVGGELTDANGLAHLGIFERDAAVKREEVTDGLSNTLVVGELAGTYPPWGDPENWRKVGRGLNKDVNGFGSYSGNGAMFLFADGSVKFFSSKTDPKLLEKMSTRDGAEN